MAKKVLLQDLNNVEILPITRGELILDSSGKEAFHSKEFLATTSLPGLMSNEDKTKLDSLVIDASLSTTSTNPVQNKVITSEINNIKKSYLKSATVSNNTLTIVDQSNNSLNFYNTTYNTFSKETSEGKGGNLGLVPIPNYNSGSSNRYLREDGTWVKPDNTTYTFDDGTNGFTVTSSGGDDEFINVIPNIANNVIYSGDLVDKQVAIFDGASGIIKASGYTIASNVPSGAKFTDTTYNNGEGLSLSNYIFSLKKSSTDKLGGIKIAKDNAYTVATHTSNLSLNITTVNQYYGVELDSTGKAFVYVPWLNTEYSLMDLTEANTGTAITARTISAKVLHDKIKSLLPSVMAGATSSSDGESGLVPKPVKGNLDKYLKGDGSWDIPLNNKVTLTNTTNNAEYRVLFSENANDTTSTEGARKSTNLKFNPNTGMLTAITFNGNLDWSKITNKPTSFTPSAHTHPTNQIDALIGYSKAESAADLATTDTLNTALGKLEYKADAAYTWYKSIFGSDTDDIINKYDEIVDFVDSVKEGSDITDEFVTRKTTQTIIGAKTFSGGITLNCGLNINGTNPITWNDGTYHQRIQTTDDSNTNTNLFEFQQSKDTGATWESLFTIKDNGNVMAAKFITTGGASSQFVKGDGSLDDNIYVTGGPYIPTSGTNSLSGSIVMSGSSSTVPFVRNLTMDITSGWARNIMGILVDGSSKFVIGAYGSYTKGSSSNSIEYAYIGCNNFDGLNLRITAESLKWGDNTILHAGNSSVSGGGSTWGSSITVKVNGTEKTLTIPSIKTLTFSSGTFASKTYNGSADETVYVPSNFNHIGDASNLYINAGTVTRRIIVQNTKNNLGYISRASIGLSNPADQFSPVIIGVGTNDAGTTYTDYYFHVGGSITDSKGNTYAKTSDIPTKTSQLTNDSGFITSRGYIGTTPIQETSGNLALTGINNITTPSYGFTITTPVGNIQIGPQNSTECHIYTNKDLFYFNKPIYYWDGSSAYVYINENTYTLYTPILNSSSTHATKSSVIYAPTTSGNGGDILISDGLGSAPVWASPGNVTVGGAGKADKLTAARTIALSGVVTGSASFDGSDNITIATTMGSHAHDAYVKKAGDTMTGTLTLDLGANLYMQTTTSILRILAHIDSNYILSGNKQFNGNVPLYISGHNGTTGTDLYLLFARVRISGSIYGTSNAPLNVDTEATSEVGIRLYMNGTSKAWMGYTPGLGAMLYTYDNTSNGTHKIGVSDSGEGFVDSNTLLHSGNWSDYITIPTKTSQLNNDSGFITSRGYIGTTTVSSASNAGQNITGIGNITPNATKSYSLGSSALRWNSAYINSFNIRGSENSRVIEDLGTTGLLYINTSAANGLAILHKKSSTYGIVLASDLFRPLSTGLVSLGNPTYRWNNVYANHLNAEGGKFYTDANGAYWTSDIRFKTNITKARNLDIADLLVEFDWKDSGYHSWGYIAQDLLEILPEAVSYSEDTDRYSVNYNVAHSAAIASLTARIKELEEKLKKYGIL